MDIGVITNPRSRRNRGRPDRAAELQELVADRGEVRATPSVEAIKPVLRDFLRKGATYWVADGGDGALHWMARAGFELLEEEEFRRRRSELPPILPTRGGTIDFVANQAGVRGDAFGLLAALRGHLERGEEVPVVRVDSMRIAGVSEREGREEPFQTIGFGVAAGGVGQRFFSKYYADDEPSPRTIVKVVARTLASMPIALSPLRRVPGVPASVRDYAGEIFRPARARVTVDGEELPSAPYTGIHIASMSINLGGVFRFFTKAEEPGALHAIVGAVSPLTIVRNLPRMHAGREMRGEGVVDRACREMVIEADGDEELLDPIIDGEYYRGIRRISFALGPRVRIPKVDVDAQAGRRAPGRPRSAAA